MEGQQLVRADALVEDRLAMVPAKNRRETRHGMETPVAGALPSESQWSPAEKGCQLLPTKEPEMLKQRCSEELADEVAWDRGHGERVFGEAEGQNRPLEQAWESADGSKREWPCA